MGKTEYKQRLWIACTCVGIFTLCLAVFIVPMFPKDMAADLSGYGGAIYAFEFAQSPTDLRQIFGVEGDPDRTRRLAMMDRGNRWDFLFMSAYTLFAVLFGLAACKADLGLGARIIAVAMIAGFADMLETQALLSITADMRANISVPSALHHLWTPVRVKFAALAVTVFGAGLFILSRRGRFWTLLGGMSALAAVLTLPALWQPSQYGALLGLSIGMGWTIMLVYAAVQAKMADG